MAGRGPMSKLPKSTRSGPSAPSSGHSWTSPNFGNCSDEPLLFDVAKERAMLLFSMFPEAVNGSYGEQ